MKERRVCDIPMRLGENALENNHLVRSARANDVWVHLDAFPSGHVVVACDDEPPPRGIVREAARWCLENTKYKRVKFTKACTTKISNVIPGDRPGEVQFKSNRRVERFFI
jgi:predicted ribosome quality control (RQC) complex YloA/Tae2 family protein